MGVDPAAVPARCHDSDPIICHRWMTAALLDEMRVAHIRKKNTIGRDESGTYKEKIMSKTLAKTLIECIRLNALVLIISR